MKRLALTLTSIAAFAGPAVAADLPARAYTKAPAPVAAAFSWTGCYVGGEIGYKSASSNQTWANSGSVRLPDGTPITGTLRPSGAIGGVTVGCNYQFAANWVAGIEADYSWTDLRSSATLLPPANVLHTFEIRERSFATARARLGYTIDHWLFFVTGGAAWARVDASDSNLSTPGGTLFQSAGQTYTGWTVGGGLEYAITRNWLVKAEYLYADLGTNRISLRTALGGDADVSLKQHVGRVGVNYKF